MGSNPISSIAKGRNCNLAITTIDNIVAAGVMYERSGPDEKIHNVRLGEFNVRVSIKKVFSPSTILPVPVPGEMEILKDALGSLVAWPEEFVIIDCQDLMNNNGGHKHKMNYAGQTQGSKKDYGGCAIVDVFTNTLKTLDIDGISIPIQKEMFGEKSTECYVFKKDLLEFCAMEPVDITCVAAYMRHLYDKHERLQRMFSFINPASFSAASAGEVPRFITNRLKNAKRNQICFIPSNLKEKFHWVLIVVDLSSMNCYWLDSKNTKPVQLLKFYISTGLAKLFIDGKKMPTPTWKTPKCPHQEGSFECGYFVMRFMRDLMEDPSHSIDMKIMMLAEKETYTIDEINEVRAEFIEFVVVHIPQ